MANAVHIIGNGFDLRMGMPTGYPSFLKFYEPLKAPNSEIEAIKMRFFQRMRLEEAKEKNKWADLEIALGAFTKEETNIELFKDFCRDANRELINYLKSVEMQSPIPSGEEKEKFLKWELFQENWKVFSDATKSLEKEIARIGERKTLEHLFYKIRDNGSLEALQSLIDTLSS